MQLATELLLYPITIYAKTRHNGAYYNTQYNAMHYKTYVLQKQSYSDLTKAMTRPY